jgi:cation diffusion facilitator CzcD-associated flavoprotein CzcO
MDYDILIIGTGFGGLGLAMRLQQEGKRSFILLERADEIGGTWRDNIYPGCACDVPSHLYSFSFELNPTWSRVFSQQPEILAYMHRCKEKYDLERHIQYNTTVTEAQLDEQTQTWKVTAANGKTWRVRTVVAALGPLNIPNIPNFEGRERFAGAQFHSSEWQEGVVLDNKKVAIVGTGASAIQIAPNIADTVQTLTVFQRTAPWIFPKNDAPIKKLFRAAYKRLPLAQRLRRSGIYWFMEYTGKGLFKENMIRTITKRLAEKHLKKQVSDPVLREKLRPNYTVGCKRRLPSDDYFPTLMKEHVHLETNAIRAIVPEGIIDETGKLHEADVIIYATGFHVIDYSKRRLKIIGRSGEKLLEKWSTELPQAYHGTAVANYPGLFLILGPNTGLGHNSQLHVMESQFNFILDYWKHLDGLPEGSLLDVKPAAQQQFNEQIQEQLSTMVWSTGTCQSWYINEEGKNPTLWPGHTTTFRKRTKQLQIEDFETLKPA